MSQSFGRNVLKLLSSKIASQLVTVISAPIIARLFSPENFGIFQISMSITSVVSVIACLRYELSIPLSRNNDEASISLVLSLLVLTFFSLLVFVTVFFFSGNIAQWYKSIELKSLLLISTSAIFLNGLRSILGYWSAYKSQFGIMAISNFIYFSVSTISTMVWGWVIDDSAKGMFICYISGIAFGSLTFIIILGRILLSDIKGSTLNLSKLLRTASYHRKFPMFSTWSSLFNTLSVQLPTFVLGYYFPKNIVGYYSLSDRVVGLPMGLVGVAMGQVFFPAGAKEYNETGTMFKIVTSTFKRLIQIGIFPMTILIFLGPILFRIIFGVQWVEAGTYVQMLAVWLLFGFVYSPLSNVFSIVNRQGTELIINIAIVSGRAITLLLGATFCSPRVTICIFALFSTIAVISLIVWMLKLSGVSILWASKALLKYIILSFAIIFPVALLSSIISQFYVIIAIAFSIIIYISILISIEPIIRRFILSLLIGFRKSILSLFSRLS